MLERNGTYIPGKISNNQPIASTRSTRADALRKTVGALFEDRREQRAFEDMIVEFGHGSKCKCWRGE